MWKEKSLGEIKNDVHHIPLQLQLQSIVILYFTCLNILYVNIFTQYTVEKEPFSSYVVSELKISNATKEKATTKNRISACVCMISSIVCSNQKHTIIGERVRKILFSNFD